jgi:DNA-binding CsgD family transcriptional regulator
MLRARPDLTPKDVVAQLSVSQAYARTLLKRARMKLEAEGKPSLAVVGSPVRDSQNREIAELHARLERAEKGLATLCSTPPPARASWNLQRRAEVLRLAGSGVPCADIANRLSIPPGEVDFIVKIDEMLRRAN